MNYHQMEVEVLLGLIRARDHGALEAQYEHYVRQVYSMVVAMTQGLAN